MTSGTFSARTVLGLVLGGALAFVAMLYFIGRGDTGPGPDNGQAHAAGRGLAGYAALAELLDGQGHKVVRSRTPSRLTGEGLLVLTPPADSDADDLARIIRDRRYIGPTLLILPKWFAMPLPPQAKKARRGWVQLLGARPAPWTSELDDGLKMEPEVAALRSSVADWEGLGLSGKLPDSSKVLGLESGPFARLVRDANGRDLVAYADDRGCYAALDEAAGLDTPEDCEEGKWALTIVFEPDLFNNYGMADRRRALVAARVIELAREGDEGPITFDLTLNGLGMGRNLLTLAFAPPFLAATLCLLLALAVVGWRAFGRFGPPIAEDRTIAFGKARLAADAGGLVRRSRRLHLLAPPYVALIARRVAGKLGLRGTDPLAIDIALRARGADQPSFSHLANALETARGASATLRAAHALYSFERTLSR